MDKVFSPPNPDKKWRKIDEFLKPHEELISRSVESKKQDLINNGFQNHGLKSLIAVGYSLALQDTEQGKEEDIEALATEQEKLYKNIPDGENDWTVGAETFTRQEVYKLLYTQRAMIENDLKRYCWDKMPTEGKNIVFNARRPIF